MRVSDITDEIAVVSTNIGQRERERDKKKKKKKKRGITD
jgi:hypothetical protein